MKSMLLAAMLIELTVCLPAEAQDAWVCTRPGYPDGDRTPQITKLHVEGDQLIDFGYTPDLGTEVITLSYTILVNNSNGIVAALAFAHEHYELPHVGDSGGPGVYVIAIDKKTFKFTESGTFVSDEHSYSVTGQCVAN